MTTLTPHIPEIQSGDLLLRAVCEEDLDPLAAFYAGARSHFVGGPLARAASMTSIPASLPSQDHIPEMADAEARKKGKAA